MHGLYDTVIKCAEYVCFLLTKMDRPNFMKAYFEISVYKNCIKVIRSCIISPFRTLIAN